MRVKEGLNASHSLPIFYVHTANENCSGLLSCQPHADFCLHANSVAQAKAILHFLERGQMQPEMWRLALDGYHCLTRRAVERLLARPLVFNSVSTLSASLGVRRHTLAEYFAQDCGLPLWRFIQLARKTVILRRHMQEGQNLREIFMREHARGADSFWRDFAYHIGVKREQFLAGERYWLWYVLRAYEKLRT